MKTLIAILLVANAASADQYQDTFDMIQRQNQRYGDGLDLSPLIELGESYRRQNAVPRRRDTRCVARPRRNPWTGDVSYVIDCEE